MGFDINVYMTLHMCPKTGKPYYYKYSENEETRGIYQCFELPTLDVPEKLCNYLVGRGHHFHPYTKYFNDKDVFDVDVDEFLESYPDWDDVLEHPQYNEESGWCYKDHKGFKKLLKWCSKQDPYFRVSWSY